MEEIFEVFVMSSMQITNSMILFALVAITFLLLNTSTKKTTPRRGKPILYGPRNFQILFSDMQKKKIVLCVFG